MRAYRSLKSSRDFERLLRQGTRSAAGSVTAYVARQVGSPGSVRLGVAARSKRGAVGRNRIKRRLRAAFVRCRISEGYDVLLRADDRAADIDFQELVETLCQRLASLTGAEAQ